MNNFHEIRLDKISSNPRNPRKSYDTRKLGELISSIKQKGVIEPIIVRPRKGKLKTPRTENSHDIDYEIVAGERRYQASVKAGLATIPAVVRELTDDEAYDFMLVENLQRDDLSEREEAESFKAYIGRRGEDGISALAERTGIAPGYIRGRIKVLELPARLLKAWDDGKIAFGHLQQLLLIQDPEEFKETVARMFSWQMTVKELMSYIKEQAPPLSSAFFPTKDRCAKCQSNSTVQIELFDIETKGARCLNPACFRKRQEEWLTANWKTTALAKKHETNGFRFEEAGNNRSNVRPFYSWGTQPGKKCKSCPHFVTVINITGRGGKEKACAGPKTCFDAVTNPRSAKKEHRFVYDRKRKKNTVD